MSRPELLLFAAAVSLLLSSCATGADPAEPLPEGSAQPSTSAEASEPSADPALTNDDPRCKTWSSPWLNLQLILHPVADVAHFPVAALDATCRWEVAAGSDTIKFPHNYEALWLDAGDATFDQVTAAFQTDGATVAVDESGGPGAIYGWLTYATISSPDGTGELALRAANHDFPNPFVTFTWTRA